MPKRKKGRGGRGGRRATRGDSRGRSSEDSGQGSDAPQDASAEPARDRDAPRLRAVAFRAVALTSPVLLLLLLEGALRVFGVGSSFPLFVPADDEGVFLRMNPLVTQRYFPGDLSAIGATYDPFRAEKASGTYRIFVQGGSSAVGFPFYYGAAFSSMLEQRLRTTFPDREIEVVNTALSAVNSYTLLDFADEILEHEPDAVLIYAGHNEFYGAFGVGATRSFGGLRALVSLYLGLSRVRTWQLLTGLVRGPGESPSVNEGTRMQRMAGDQEIAYGSKLDLRGGEQLRANLSEILGRYRSAGVPVYVATLVSNERDHPPFVSREHPAVPAALWAELAADLGGDAGETGAPLDSEVADPGAPTAGVDSVVQRGIDLVARDTLNADAVYGLARSLDRSGHPGPAREFYRAARDRDLLRFRAPGRFNEIIRSVAAAEGARVVDVEAAFVESSRDGIVGAELITEHLHPTIEGYFIMADAFYGALREGGAIGDWAGAPSLARARASVPITVVDSLAGTYLLRSLMAGWPFNGDPVIEERLRAELAAETGETPEERIALRLHRGEVPWPSAIMELAEHYESVGEPARARHAAMTVAHELPLSGAPYLFLAAAALRLDSLGVAEAHYRTALGREPHYRTAAALGSVLLRLERRDEALASLERAVALAPPDDPMPSRILAAARLMPELEARSEANPEDTALLFQLASAYAITNLTERARAVLDELLALDPTSADARALLTRLDQVAAAGGQEGEGR